MVPHILTTETKIQISLIQLRKYIAWYNHHIPLNFKDCTRQILNRCRGEGHSPKPGQKRRITGRMVNKIFGAIRAAKSWGLSGEILIIWYFY